MAAKPKKQFMGYLKKKLEKGYPHSPLIDYLKSVQQTPKLPAGAEKELQDSIKLLKKPNHINMPSANESPVDTINEIWQIMRRFFNRYPSLMKTHQAIEMQEQNFDTFLRNSGLIKKTQKPSSRPPRS